MTVIAKRELLESGVHFGHQTRRWNPRMRSFILTERNKIYIIDLEQTAARLDLAFNFIKDMSAMGKKVLFVGTKKQAHEVVAQEAKRCGMYFVNTRWLGGTLTNFVTIQKRIRRLRDLENQRDKGEWEHLTKKEAAVLEKEYQKLERSLSGIKSLDRLPDILFIVDPGKERIAVLEARKLRIPIVAMVDTNCDPDEVDYVIPANDDAIKSVHLITSKIADAIMEGRGVHEAKKDDSAPAAAPAESAEAAEAVTA